MKIKYLFTGLFVLIQFLISCEDPDSLIRTGGDNMSKLFVTGCLVSDESKRYDAIINEDNKTITIQVPLYISEEEQKKADLTRMKVFATLPLGAKFSPGISGIRNLETGFQSTLIKEDGSKTTYTFKAEYINQN